MKPWERYASGPWTKYAAPEPPSPVTAGDVARDAWQQTKDLFGGAVRGAGSIGATLMAPQDMLQDVIERQKTGRQQGVSRNQMRRADITAATAGLGANPDSMTYGAGKLGTEIAGTAGVGQALGGVAQVIPRLGPLAEPLATAGMRGGNMALRTVGGAVTGGAAAGLVDPTQAGTGAVVGGALPGSVKLAGAVGHAVGSGAKNAAANVLGLTTGVGAVPIKEAAKAGAQGNAAFLANMRGNVPLTDVLDDAKRGLDAMRAAKSAQYRSGMVPIRGDKSVLDFADIDAAINKATGIATFKGQVKNARAADAVQKMREAVEEWKALDPTQFHTPEGLDALKQKLGAVLEGLPFEERGARLAAGEVYSAAKKTIEKQAPAYAKVMKDYLIASDQIKEIERALSLGDKASKDTAMRKLQSLMRNNVQTNYGNRLDLARSLEQQGSVELMPALAGQALSSATPRSLSGQIGSGGAILGSLMTGNALPLLALPFQSPRLVGEAAYQAGRFTGPIGGNALLGLTQPDLLSFAARAAPVIAADR